MSHGIVFDFDPKLVTLGPITIRYYGVIFAATLLFGYALFWRQMRRGGHSQELANTFLIWGVLGTVAGARLGHCLFYNPGLFISDPLKVLMVWEGGLASHGATVGIFLALLLFARKYHLSLIELMDRTSMSAAVGAAGIRLGNFLNSEIVGRATDLPWAVRFVQHDGGTVARHPSQLYELGLGIFVLLIIYLADRWAGREKRPKGLLCGLFFTIYFAGRFAVEFVKEYQALPDSWLTMGQYLSIVPFLLGVGLLVWTWRNSREAKFIPTGAEPEPAPDGETAGNSTVLRNKPRPRRRKRK